MTRAASACWCSLSLSLWLTVCRCLCFFLSLSLQGTDEVLAEDIAVIHICNDREGRGASKWVFQARRDEFEELTLSEMGLDEGFSVGIATVSYEREVDRRYGRRAGRGAAVDAVAFGDMQEDDAAGGLGYTAAGRSPTTLAEAKSVQGKHRVPSSMVYDFRRCDDGKMLPAGVSIRDNKTQALADKAKAKAKAKDKGKDKPKGKDQPAGSAEPEPEGEGDVDQHQHQHQHQHSTEVVGLAADLEEQNDKSYALLLKKGQYLELGATFAPKTMDLMPKTMDILFQKRWI